ncbi:MAG: FkbM family methyltransferase [Pirellulaceae bacterium]
MNMLRSLHFLWNHPLNRHDRLAALSRFLRWQIGSRLLPGPIVYSWIGGARILIRRGETGMTGNLYAGLHEFADMAYLLHVLRAGDFFVDVGANVGSYTLLASTVSGARVTCFEPIPETFDRLMDNVRLNRLEHLVEARNEGVGAHTGRLQFLLDRNTMNRPVAQGEEAKHAMEVPVVTIDSVLGDRVPQMMKIDVEGYETAVIEGAQKTLADPRLHSVVMELAGAGSQYGFDEDRLLNRCELWGFKAVDMILSAGS